MAHENVSADESYKTGLNILQLMDQIGIDKFLFKKKDSAAIMKSESPIKIEGDDTQCFYFHDLSL